MKCAYSRYFILVLATCLFGQTFRGTILGTVTDQSGAVVAGATITVKNTATGLERAAQTSTDGSYSIPELPIGTYTVTVTQAGFQTSMTREVTVNVATERRVDSQLKPARFRKKLKCPVIFCPRWIRRPRSSAAC